MISINSVENPHYSTISNNYIDVVFDTVEYGHIPSTVSNTDFTEYTIFDHNINDYISITNQQIFINAENGMYGNVMSFTVDLPNAKKIAYDKVAESCENISLQIIPNQTKQLAYQNALFLLTLNNNNPPTTGVAAASFNNLAASWGMTNAVFAQLIIGMQNLSINLGALELGAQNQINNAQNAGQLLAMLNTFETSLTNLVTQVNSMVPIPISRPNPILIKGVNS